MTRRLHIGGKQPKEGWEILNALDDEYVDHIGNANDLSIFKDNLFSEIYASHIAEHLDHKDELLAALKEWLRVLKPGGKLSISVPDLDVLAACILSKDQLSFQERYIAMCMMFGGHKDQYDYHVVGLNEEFLTNFLTQAGFRHIRRTDNFGLFDDASSLKLRGVPISLNMVAEKASLAELIESASTKPSKNQPCPCGSGKKYKRCHGSTK